MIRLFLPSYFVTIFFSTRLSFSLLALSFAFPLPQLFSTYLPFLPVFIPLFFLYWPVSFTPACAFPLFLHSSISSSASLHSFFSNTIFASLHSCLPFSLSFSLPLFLSLPLLSPSLSHPIFTLLHSSLHSSLLPFPFIYPFLRLSYLYPPSSKALIRLFVQSWLRSKIQSCKAVLLDPRESRIWKWQRRVNSH